MREDKIFREALSFSKIEGVKHVDFRGYNVRRSYMKVLKIFLGVSLGFLVALGGFLLFYDRIFVFQERGGVVTLEEKEVKREREEARVEESSQIDAIVSMVLGEVKVQDALKVSDLEVGYRLKEGDTIITFSNSECEVQIDKKVLVRISENTRISFSQIITSLNKGKDNLVELVRGSVKCAVKSLGKDTFKVRTSTAVATVRGTKFSVSVDEKSKTRVVVSEGRVEVGVRSRVVQDFVQKLPKEYEGVIDDYFGNIVLTKGDAIVVGSEDQKKMDSKISEVIEKAERVDEEVIDKVKKIGDGVASSVRHAKRKASLTDLYAIDSKVSKNLILTGELVKVRFEPSKGLKGVKLFVDGVEMGQLPIVKGFEKNKKYSIKAIKNGKVLLDEEMKFEKDARVVVEERLDTKLEKVEEVKEVKITAGERVETLEFGAKVVSGYGRWPVYGQKYVFYTSSGISVFDGEKIKNLNLRGNSFSVYGDNIVVVTKDQNDFLIVKIIRVDGKVIGEFNLGEATKGTLVIGRAVLIDKNVFVPTIDGVYIIDIKTGERKVVNIGSVYSDLAILDSNSIVCVNEIGEVYVVNSSGSYTKISQLSATTARRGILTADSGRIYIMLGNVLYLVERNKDVRTINLGIRPDSEPIVYGSKVVITGEKKVLVMNKDGVILNTITLSGNLVVSPYVGGGYIVVSTTDGTYLYDIETGQLKRKFDIVGNVAFVFNKRLYIVTDNTTKVVDVE